MFELVVLRRLKKNVIVEIWVINMTMKTSLFQVPCYQGTVVISCQNVARSEQYTSIFALKKK